MIIYKITNKITNKLYIGLTTRSLDQRWKEHKKIGNQYSLIKKEIQKYGEENFKIEEIDECSSIADLNQREEFWIQELNTLAPNGYNLTTGGLAAKHSEVTKAKMSKTRKGKHPHWATEASRSEEARKKRSDSHKENGSIVWTEERRNNSRLGAKSRMKQIKDNYGDIYESLAEASRETGCHRVSIQRILKGEAKRAFGKEKKEYNFTYEEA